jgi:hypothetical protein
MLAHLLKACLRALARGVLQALLLPIYRQQRM